MSGQKVNLSSLSHFLTHPLIHTHSPTHSLSHTHSYTHSLSHTLSHTHKLSLTHTHTEFMAELVNSYLSGLIQVEQRAPHSHSSQSVNLTRDFRIKVRIKASDFIHSSLN